MLAKPLREFFTPTTLWSIANWVWPAGTAVVSAWLSWFWSLSPSIILFVALISAMIALVIVNELKRASIFDKLSIEEFKPIYLFSSPDEVHMIQLGAKMRNHHEYVPIFFDWEVLSLVIQSRSNIDAKRVGSILSVAPNGGSPMLFPAVQDIKTGEVTGRLHIKVRYGRTIAHLKRTMEFKLGISGLIYKVEDGRLACTVNIMREEIVSA